MTEGFEAIGVGDLSWRLAQRFAYGGTPSMPGSSETGRRICCRLSRVCACEEITTLELERRRRWSGTSTGTRSSIPTKEILKVDNTRCPSLSDGLATRAAK